MTINLVNNKFLNDLSVQASAAGVARSLLIQNTDNTNAASHAKLQITTGGASGGDPYLSISTTASSASVGLDNSLADTFKIASSATVETTTNLGVLGGNVVRPLQPAFRAYRNAAADNVTGNGAWYSIIYDVENFDQNSDYSTATGIFTAPITGNYYLSTGLVLNGCDEAVLVNIGIVTTSLAYYQPFGGCTGGHYIGSHVSVVAPMTAGDTAYVRCAAVGEESNRDDMRVTEGIENFFCGYLLQ